MTPPAPGRAENFDLDYDVRHFAAGNSRVHRQPSADGSRNPAAKFEARKPPINAKVRELAVGNARFYPQRSIGPLPEAAQLAELNGDTLEATVECQRVEACSDHPVGKMVFGADAKRTSDLFACRWRGECIHRPSDA